MTRVFICATLALAQAAIAAANDHVVVLQDADAPMPDPVVPADESVCRTEYDYDGNCLDSYHEGSDDDIKDAIKDAVEDALERYVDEEAVEQWADETASAFQDMQQRQQQETAEWAEGVAK